MPNIFGQPSWSPPLPPDPWRTSLARAAAAWAVAGTWVTEGVSCGLGAPGVPAVPVSRSAEPPWPPPPFRVALTLPVEAALMPSEEKRLRKL
ncbi:hypothetical protein ACF09J_25065 [Streptomyces sp. NPDC014889]|uniref:hypothetical protein n=1 Tax=Streptomyces sp. NPDC014889 TaxID=3364928 RepID=UPI0036FC3E9A